MGNRTDAAMRGMAILNIREFGAQGDGQAKDTAAIQRLRAFCEGQTVKQGVDGG